MVTEGFFRKGAISTIGKNKKQQEMAQYAILGHPIAHSLSPIIHTYFAEQTGDAPFSYTKIDCPVHALEDVVRAFFARGGKGLNITVPHKQAICSLVDNLSPAAQRAGAVNTVIAKNTEDKVHLLGDNTDGTGMLGDLHNLDFPIAQKDLLIIGAGGATRGIMEALIHADPASISVVNRDQLKGKILVDDFSANFQNIFHIASSHQLEGKAFHAIINATSASLHGVLPFATPIPSFSVTEWGYDLVYDLATPTVFLRWLRKSAGSVALADGLGMLVGQAAESFYRWRGVYPDSKAVIQALRTRTP